MSMIDYQMAKDKLIGKDGTFSGWVRSGAKWQCFDLNQRIASPKTQSDP